MNTAQSNVLHTYYPALFSTTIDYSQVNMSGRELTNHPSVVSSIACSSVYILFGRHRSLNTSWFPSQLINECKDGLMSSLNLDVDVLWDPHLRSQFHIACK